MVTALQVLGAMQDADRRLSELANEVEEYPQVLDGVRVRDKSRWKENPAISSAIDEASNALRGRGRLHVRASGTEPLIRVMAEGPVEAELKELVGGVCSAIRETIGAEN